MKVMKVLFIALFSLANHLDKTIKTSYSQKALTPFCWDFRLLQFLHTQARQHPQKALPPFCWGFRLLQPHRKHYRPFAGTSDCCSPSESIAALLLGLQTVAAPRKEYVLLSSQYSFSSGNATIATIGMWWMTQPLINLVRCSVTHMPILTHDSQSSRTRLQEFLQHPHATVIPKMHLLEDHTVPLLRRWYLEAGLMGEQGKGGGISPLPCQEVGDKLFWYTKQGGQAEVYIQGIYAGN